MKCFIHNNEEAIAACKICGKGMCANCSAYSNHTGICPECKKADYEDERKYLLSEKAIIPWKIAGWTLVSITIIGAIIGVPMIFCRVKDLNKMNDRIEFLNTEITKLNEVIKHTGIAKI